MNMLYVMRGLPGSGKSTIAREIIANHGTGVILSTDDYWCRDGDYRFNPALLFKAHDWNFKRAKMSFEAGVKIVVIDNTNILRSHFINYTTTAQSYGYDIREVVVGRFDDEFVDICHARCIHGVPHHTIKRMAMSFEP